jgi:hypothetical protein
VNVWCGLIADQLTGPWALEQRLTADTYMNFVTNEFPLLMEDVTLETRRGSQVTAHLYLRYENRWIGRSGPVPWPPKSPDLTPLDFI